MTARWLLLRRDGVLWGVPSRDVGTIRSRGGGVAVQLASSRWLQAEELLEVATGLRPRALPSCLGELEMPRLEGVAVWQQTPVLVLERGGEPPAALGTESEVGRGAAEREERGEP